MNAYNYRRSPRFAASDEFTSYSVLLSKVHINFVGDAGERLYTYITTLHGRIGRHEPWSNIMFFDSWDYGNVSGSDDKYSIRVWQKSSAQYPKDIEPNILLTVDFSSGVEVEAKAGHSKTLFKKKFPVSVTASSVGMAVGEAWEKLLTGSVDYGD